MFNAFVLCEHESVPLTCVMVLDLVVSAAGFPDNVGNGGGGAKLPRQYSLYGMQYIVYRMCTVCVNFWAQLSLINFSGGYFSFGGLGARFLLLHF